MTASVQKDSERKGAAGDVRTFRGIVIAFWLASGLGLHAYFSRAAQGPAEVEEKRSLYLRQFENDDRVAEQIRESHWRSNSTVAGAYAAWAAAGGVLAVLSVRSWCQSRSESHIRKAGKGYDA
jgi:hypothetical protein